MNFLASIALKLYRILLRPVLHALMGPGPHCRFEPSCSQYASEAFRKHHFFKAFYLTAKRLLCCHPWHPGGVDKVPE